MKNRYQVLYLLVLAGICSRLLLLCGTMGQVMNLDREGVYSPAFRRQELSEETLEQLQKIGADTQLSLGTLLSAWMPTEHYRLKDPGKLTGSSYNHWDTYLKKYRSADYKVIQEAFQAIWDDLVYFPVDIPVTYENTWMYERSYGGKRGHEGTDLMPEKNKRDLYPIYSMTNGRVEKIGWLEKGGYRIGIRSAHGGYFYYAHLSSYASDFKVGQQVEAGEILGYMGDSGYGEEGTIGKFDVHLHLGIYITTEEKEEISVNPYWILRSLESHTLKCRYYMCYNGEKWFGEERKKGTVK